MNNLILMGPPGAGKTTIGKVLAKMLNRPFLDLDDDHLENVWNMPVSQKLRELGDTEFLEAEGVAGLELNISNHVLALSGSAPLHQDALNHYKKIGTLIYIDIPHNVILDRLKEMKVDRIVGMKDSTIQDVLAYRKSFYEKSYDVRVMFSKSHDVHFMATKINDILNVKESKYISTRGSKESISFLDAVAKGLASDGGLYIPEKLPYFDVDDLLRLQGLTYQDLACKVLEKFSLGELKPNRLKEMVSKAYSENFQEVEIAPTSYLEKNQYLLELYHGPTAAFKDMALQLTPQFFGEAVKNEQEDFLILAATSGDTGVAALEGYRPLANVKTMVLYPKDGVSIVQKQQMLTCFGENVFTLAVDADFDFCQKFVKDIFNDLEFNNEIRNKFRYKLSSANSINWGRLLPQIVYYFSTYLSFVDSKKIQLGEKIDFCIPTGNFGNILAGFLAKKMGLPIQKLICASNVNNVLTDFISTGTYDINARETLKTISPSIDILKSSNVERLLYLISMDSQKVKNWMNSLEKNKRFELSTEELNKIQETFQAGFCSEEDTPQTIKSVFEKTGRLLDPHTAVAKAVTDKFQSERPMVIASTAHFGKFLPAMQKALNIPKSNSLLASLKDLQKIAPKEKSHLQLQEALVSPIKEKNISSADYNHIKNAIRSFLN